MPYIVKRGRVDAGAIVYDAGQELPADVVDEAMIEAGSVAFVTDKQFVALAETDLARKSNRELRELCEARGLDAERRMNKDELIALLEGTGEDAPGVDSAEE